MQAHGYPKVCCSMCGVAPTPQDASCVDGGLREARQPACRCVAIEKDVDACIRAIMGLLLVCPESQAREGAAGQPLHSPMSLLWSLLRHTVAGVAVGNGSARWAHLPRAFHTTCQLV